MSDETPKPAAFDFAAMFQPGALPSPLTDAELAAIDERQALEREKAQRAERERRWARACPERYRWAREGAPELAMRVQLPDGLPAAWQLVRRVLVTRQALAITGSKPGTGKSSMGAAALRMAFERGMDVAMISAHKLGQARIQHPAGHGEAPIVERAMTVPLLLLDDLGNERQTATNAVPDVLFERHEAGLQTWVTTGETGEQLQAKYGGGVVRRVFENAAVIRCEARRGE